MHIGRAKLHLIKSLKVLVLNYEELIQMLIVFGLQPGTVDSELSEPFKRNVKEGNLFTPEYSVLQLKNIIDIASPSYSGKLISWDGEEIQP